MEAFFFVLGSLVFGPLLSTAAYAPARGCDAWLNGWCDANCPHFADHGSLLARLDTTSEYHVDQWRCYARVTLTVDLTRYESGSTFCTRQIALLEELERCLAATGRAGAPARGGAPAAPADALAQQPGECANPASAETPSAATTPAATIATPRATPLSQHASSGASSERFLLFSVAEHEQINKQRRALLHFMRLARNLGRTLVLPRVHQVRKDKRAWQPGTHRHGNWYVPSANEYLKLSAVYNLSTMAAYQPLLELGDFWQLPEEALGLPWSSEQGAEERRVDVFFRAGSPGQGGSCSPGLQQTVAFNGVERVLAAELRCGMPSHDTAMLLALAEQRVLAFAESYDQVPEAQAKALVPFLTFTDAIYAQAQRFASSAFNGEPFLAVHWRRADFKLTRSTRSDVLLDAAQLVARVEAVLAERGLRHVYLATDATEEDSLALVVERLRPQRFSWTANADEQDLGTAMDVANIEVAICAMASYFLGTRTSNFSLTIREERAARGLPEISSDFLAFAPAP